MEYVKLILYPLFCFCVMMHKGLKFFIKKQGHLLESRTVCPPFLLLEDLEKWSRSKSCLRKFSQCKLHWRIGTKCRMSFVCISIGMLASVLSLLTISGCNIKRGAQQAGIPLCPVMLSASMPCGMPLVHSGTSGS